MSLLEQQAQLERDKNVTRIPFKRNYLNWRIKPTLYRVTADDMIKFSKSIGCTNPKYTKIPKLKSGFVDFGGVKPHPMYPSCFTIKPVFKLQNIEHKITKQRLITDTRKFLHASHRFIYKDIHLIRHGQLLSTNGEV
ncbi:MAG: hypothetical protein GF364_02110, partial [Candidatus Lokiarchaeota archaeon]|nr:hypothetical protein [Candidatus Lokiarchaeota archaeon]